LDGGGGDDLAGGDLRLEVERGGAVLAGGHVGDGVDDPGTAHDGDLDGEAVGGGDLLSGDVEDPRTQVDAPQCGGPGPPAAGAGARKTTYPGAPKRGRPEDNRWWESNPGRTVPSRGRPAGRVRHAIPAATPSAGSRVRRLRVRCPANFPSCRRNPFPIRDSG